MRALADLSRVFAGTLDPDVVSERIADSVRSLFSSVSASLFRVEPGSGDLVPVATSTGRGGDTPPAPVLPRGVGISGLAAESRHVVVSSDVPADPRIEKTDAVRDWIAAVGHYSAIAVPLIVNDVVVGVLTVSGERGRVFGEDDARLAQTFADQAALALANARLYAESAQRRAEAEELARLARTLTESLDVSEVVERTVESVLPLFRAQSSVVRLLRPACWPPPPGPRSPSRTRPPAPSGARAGTRSPRSPTPSASWRPCSTPSGRPRWSSSAPPASSRRAAPSGRWTRIAR